MQCFPSVTFSPLSSPAVAVMMRVAVIVMVMVSAMMSVAATAAFTSACCAISAVAVVGCYAPEAMATPSAFLAFFGAVLRTAAATALGKLAGEFLPFAALPVGTLADATT